VKRVPVEDLEHEDTTKISARYGEKLCKILITKYFQAMKKKMDLHVQKISPISPN
jgi:hypothetical protein